jgi:hypothetical protein
MTWEFGGVDGAESWFQTRTQRDSFWLKRQSCLGNNRGVSWEVRGEHLLELYLPLWFGNNYEIGSFACGGAGRSDAWRWM